MKAKAIIPLVLGLCMGLVAVKFLVQTLQNARGSPSNLQTATVVRAKVDIGSLEAITPELVELVQTPESALIPAGERFNKIEEVAGRVTAKAIPQHSPVLVSMLAPEGTIPGMKGRIKPGYRAVSVKISEISGVAYHITPGDWVDVIVVMDVDTGNRTRKKDTIAEVILQHVEVLAIGQTTGEQPGDAGQNKAAKSATLLVAEGEAPKLHLAGTRGRITLALRGDDDRLTGKPASARESEDFDFGQGLATETDPTSENQRTADATAAPKLVAPAPTPHSVAIYHGTSATDMKVDQLIFADENSREVVQATSGPVNRVGPAARDELHTPIRHGYPMADQPDRVEPLRTDEESVIEEQEIE